MSNLKDFFRLKGLKEITDIEKNKTVLCLNDTEQLRLEKELLNSPEYTGFFYVSKKNQSPDSINSESVFETIEFVSKGTLSDLVKFKKNLLNYLGFSGKKTISYDEICEKYLNFDFSDKEIGGRVCSDLGPVVSINKFPAEVNSFWENKKGDNNRINKVDVFMYGEKTISITEKSSDKQQIRESFYDEKNKDNYSLLCDSFGMENVNEELEKLLSFDLFSRYSGSINIDNLFRSWSISQSEIADTTMNYGDVSCF